MKQLGIVLITMIVISVLSCNPQDLMNAVDRYDFVIRLADLAKAVLDDDFTVDWEGLQRLQLRYDVNLVEPTTNFLISASNLRAAYKELAEKINVEEQSRLTEQELSRALQRINE